MGIKMLNIWPDTKQTFLAEFYRSAFTNGLTSKNAKKTRDLRLSVNLNYFFTLEYIESSAFRKSTKTHLSSII